MAKLIGIISSGSGKVGNLVLTKGKAGRVIARAYQPQVNNPNTARQQSARRAFADSVALARPFGQIRHLYNVPFGRQAASFRAAISYPDNVQEITYSHIPFSKGAGVQIMDTPLIARANFEGDLAVVVTWTPDAVLKDIAASYMENPTDDKLMFVGWLYQPYLKQVVTGFALYDAGSLSIKVPTLWSGTAVHLYCCCRIAPASATTIPTTTAPWKYPAPTSYPIYVGSGNVE